MIVGDDPQTAVSENWHYPCAIVVLDVPEFQGDYLCSQFRKRLASHSGFDLVLQPGTGAPDVKCAS